MVSFGPRSIFSLILVAFAVVLTPFVAAVVTAVVQVDRLAAQGRAAVRDAGAAAGFSRNLVEQANNMERQLFQYRVGDDRLSFDVYLDERKSFLENLADLIALDLESLDDAALAELAGHDAAIFTAVGGEAGILDPDWTWELILERLSALRTEARAVRQASDALIEAQANEPSEQAEAVQRLLFAITMVAVPVTIVLVGLFTVLITRPMRALGLAIRRLGARASTEPIAVSGPRDIEALGRELDWLRRRILALEEQKTSFLRQISHELKTPLTTLREGSELLVETLGDDQQEEAEIARLMQVNSLRLQALIENLLEFAETLELTNDLRLEAGIDLAGLVRGSVESVRVTADVKDIAFDLRLDPVVVRGDAGKLGIVVENLLANAIRFTPPGGSIIVSLAADGESSVMDVVDTGPGIDAADRERIFEPFQRGSAEYRASVGGTGLGLAIAKEHVEAHEGEIGVVGSGPGAHFRVRVPIRGPASGTDGGNP